MCPADITIRRDATSVGIQDIPGVLVEPGIVAGIARLGNGTDTTQIHARCVDDPSECQKKAAGAQKGMPALDVAISDVV